MLPSRLIACFPAVPVAVGGTIVLATVVALAGWSGNGLALAACIFCVGFFDAVVDVAQNAVGTEIQDKSGRSILSSMHALWSLSGVVSGAASVAAATAGIDMRLYLATVGLACIILVTIGGLLVGDTAMTAKTNYERGTSDEEGPSRWPFQRRFPDPEAGAVMGRSSRRNSHHARWVRHHDGARAHPTPHRAGRRGIRLSDSGPHRTGCCRPHPRCGQIAGVTLVNWIMRIGFFVTSPPLVGLITTATNLGWGLSILLLSGTVALVLASRLSTNENAVEPDSPDTRERDGTNSPPG